MRTNPGCPQPPLLQVGIWIWGGGDECWCSPRPRPQPLPGPSRCGAEVGADPGGRQRRGAARPGPGSALRGARTTPAVTGRKAAWAPGIAERPAGEPAASRTAPRRGGAVALGWGAKALQRVLISFRSFCSSRRGNPLPPSPPCPRHVGTAPLRRAEFGVNSHLAALE